MHINMHIAISNSQKQIRVKQNKRKPLDKQTRPIMATKENPNTTVFIIISL